MSSFYALYQAANNQAEALIALLFAAGVVAIIGWMLIPLYVDGEFRRKVERAYYGSVVAIAITLIALTMGRA